MRDEKSLNLNIKLNLSIIVIDTYYIIKSILLERVTRSSFLAKYAS